MSLLDVLLICLVLAAIGVGLYWFNRKATQIDRRFVWLINAVVIIAVVIWLGRAFGLWAALASARL